MSLFLISKETPLRVTTVEGLIYYCSVDSNFSMIKLITLLARITITLLKQLAGLKYDTVSESSIDVYIG